MSGIAGISDLKVEMKHARMKFRCKATFDIRIITNLSLVYYLRDMRKVLKY